MANRVQEMFLLEGAGGIYLFWPSKLGCGRHLFRPTSKYILGGGVVGLGQGSRRWGAGVPEKLKINLCGLR